MIMQTYHYYVDNAPEHDPIMRRFQMHVAKPLDLQAIRGTMQLIQVSYNFYLASQPASFCVLKV
jgi:tRNA U38,U39,U40 pseudouridine synthase TruA